MKIIDPVFFQCPLSLCGICNVNSRVVNDYLELIKKPEYPFKRIYQFQILVLRIMTLWIQCSHGPHRNSHSKYGHFISSFLKRDMGCWTLTSSITLLILFYIKSVLGKTGSSFTLLVSILSDIYLFPCEIWCCWPAHLVAV